MIKRKAKRIHAKQLQPSKPAVQVKQGFGCEMPPPYALVEIYFDQKGMAAQAGIFYRFYEAANWSSPKGTAFRNWKVLATDWIYNFLQEVKLYKRRKENAIATRGL
jgi:hypothetical protein